MKSKRMGDKMNKEQIYWWSLVDLVGIKITLTAIARFFVVAQ